MPDLDAELSGGAWVGWVDNRDDPPSTVAYLHAVGSYRRHPRALAEFQPVVVRPTPGGDLVAVGFDLLTALGKGLPQMTERPQRLRGYEVWDAARAWLRGARITDLIIDRAHQLPVDVLLDLLAAAQHAAAAPWLIWSGTDDVAAARTAETLTAVGYHVATLPPATMQTVLPDPVRVLAATEAPAPAWPVLPAADFTTFRAACRRHLGRDAFARVDAVYRAARDRTDEHLAVLHQRHHGDLPLLPPALADIAADLYSWLRDVQLGPASDPATALITLRATQAALFGHAILLRWSPDTLGPDPAGRLPGNLTRQVTAALNAGAHTSTAAAAALALHLNQGPAYLTCLRVGDVADDGSRLAGPPTGPDHHHGLAHPVLNADSPSGIAERACAGTILIPAHARAIIAAHLAYRRGQGASDDDPYFAHRRTPGHDPTAQLRHELQRASQQLHLNPPWLHPDPCKYGADIGLTARTHGWLIERRLTLAQLDRYAAHRPAYRYPAAGHE